MSISFLFLFLLGKCSLLQWLCYTVSVCSTLKDIAQTSSKVQHYFTFPQAASWQSLAVSHFRSAIGRVCTGTVSSMTTSAGHLSSCCSSLVKHLIKAFLFYLRCLSFVITHSPYNNAYVRGVLFLPLPLFIVSSI